MAVLKGDAPRIAAIVLAAGRSARMGIENKLLADIAGKPMVRRVVEVALASRARPVHVVTGHMAADVADALYGLDVTIVANPDYATGLASSLKAGIRALDADCDGALVMLGDMPKVTPDHLDALVAVFAPGTIVVPVHAGRQGNPVLWAARFFPELLQLKGDAGAKRLIGAHEAEMREVDLGSDAIFADVDTPAALAALRMDG
jgi:molybdenum cofactor cytidylyltransferase